ncbi:MAG: neutral/alkaline non-lysosomal ceramidase N-terminal domain-containing protein [Acidobacteria bacterium]|nr:neutral/alkaline non-lysosomal ceramidase N-terminal domain-containing protein [Acidobacteriota bacterium]
MTILRCFALLIALLIPASAADWKIGVARMKITPSGPIWMSGYGNRNKPSEGVVHDLWAKAIALEDKRGQRAVIVTTDLIGLPRAISEQIGAECQKRWGLDRSRLMLNSSHTHTGPMVRENLNTMFDFSPEESQRVRDYAQLLTKTLIDTIGAALGDLQPGDIAFGQGTAPFAVNRRQFNPNGKVTIGINPQGAVDHDVPVLALKGRDGKLRAVLFGYACHNTTLTGEFYRLSGDYAGFAQIEFEKMHPEAVGMFMLLAGGDQNPNPRSKDELAIQHGRTLATAVDTVLKGQMKPVRGPLRAAFQLTELQFAPHTREDFEKELSSKTPAAVRRAKEMLKAYDERRPVTKVAYPVQAIRLGKDVTYVALGGELVVGYSLRTKKEFPGETTVVAGYSNDVMCYIPTAQILKEGGYEAVDSMIYYGQPGPFAPDVEERVMGGVKNVMKSVGRAK